MKNPNIKIEYKNGQVESYVAVSGDGLFIPSCLFKTEEEAEFCVATAKLLKANGKDTSEIIKLLPYMLRMMGIKSNWTE